MPALYLSAAHKSSGKTSISIGLCRALHDRGMVVQPFKKGPDYIDPMWLGQAAKRPCHNLDFYIQSHDEIERVYRQHGHAADITLIEGNKGLYDGLDLDGSNSNAALAKQLEMPAILVLDVRGTIRGVAPLLLGYQQFDPDINIGGVILNRVGGSRHEQKLRDVIEHYTDIPVLGAVQNEARLEIVERHLGLTPSNEASEVEQRITDLAQAVTDQVDLDRLIQMAQQAAPIEEPVPAPRPELMTDKLRIGIARDSAFGFYYQGDLDALEQNGAEVIPINMQQAAELPKIDGLFIGGGFPETQMEALSANTTLHQSIRDAIEDGLPVYAECGGLMYLTRSITWQEKTLPMVGIIPADTLMHPKPIGKGYIRIQATPEHPWPKLRHDHANVIRGHEFHYSKISPLPANSQFAYKVLRGTGIDDQHDGFVYKNLLACYAHLRHVDATPWTHHFLYAVRKHKSTGGH